MNNTGRPTKYKEEYCQIAEDALADGYTVRSVAAILNVTHVTVYEWMKHHTEFSNAIKAGQDKGLKYLEDKMKKLMDGNKQNRPDVTTLIFALKTRYHEVYGDRSKIEQKIEQTSKIEINIDSEDQKL